MSGAAGNAVVIGAGPAGLTAASELLRRGWSVTVLEASDSVGGLARTVNHHGNRLDIGGHRFFSKQSEVMDWWLKRLPLQGAPARDESSAVRDPGWMPGGPDPEQTDAVMLWRRRLSRIYFRNSLFDYPLSLSLHTLRSLGLMNTVRVCAGYAAAQCRKRPEHSLEDFMVNRFGVPLYRMFFESYTRKIWGRHPSELSADWGTQRIRGLSLGRALSDRLFKSFRVDGAHPNAAQETSLIDHFLYPKFGPGQLWDRVAEEIHRGGGRIMTRARVTGVDVQRGRVTRVHADTPQGAQALTADEVFSSMPAGDLVRALRGCAVPPDVERLAAELPYRDFLIVGLEVRRLNAPGASPLRPRACSLLPDCWMYFQDDAVRAGRMQLFHNWSPYLVRDWPNRAWIGMEYFCNAGDALSVMSDSARGQLAAKELIAAGFVSSPDDITDTCCVYEPKAYPAYYGAYTRFAEVRARLDEIPNLWCIGRNGQHRYNNMDHAMMSALEAVRQVDGGRREKAPVWAVNTDASYHEKR